jgi:flagellar biosynthesis/type III secretory pathway protein FliH
MGSPASTRQEHRYQTCRNRECERFLCRVYMEGYDNGDWDGYRRGYDEGYADGYAAGYGAGYDAGFSDGLASCPGPHGGG